MRARGHGKGVALQAVARALRPLEEPGARKAFVHTLRAVIDVHGQRVSARDRLYLLSEMPTLIVWGERDHTIPLAHGLEAHRAIPTATSRCSPAQPTSPTSRSRTSSRPCSMSSSRAPIRA